MLKLLAFLTLVQLAVSTIPSCSKGPSYWCQSVPVAKQCNAFKHCTESVWSKQASYVQKNALAESNECKECVHCLYNDIRQCPYLREYKNEIAQLFENNLPSESICRLLDKCDSKPPTQQQAKSLPSCTAQNQCDSLDMAIKCSNKDECMKQWISSPKKYQLKKATGLELTKQTEKDLNEERACGFCIFVVTKYQSLIAQNKTEAELKNYLESACRLLPTSDLQKKCLDQVNSYLPEIFNFLRDNADPGVVCHVIQMCKDSNLEEVEPKKFDWSKVQIKVIDSEKTVIKTPLQESKAHELALKLAKTNGMACEMCNMVVEAASFLVKNDVDNKVVLEFIEKNLCARLGEFGSTCVEYIKEMGEKILDNLEDEINPEICAEIGLCMDTQKNLAHPLDIKANGESSCQQCEQTMEHVKQMVTSSERDSSVLDYIKENFCMKNGDMKYLCSSTLDAHHDTLLVIFKQDIKPKQLCNLFRVCLKDNEKTGAEETAAVVKKGDDKNCILCQFLIKELDQFLYKDATEEEIQQALDKVCALFPGQYKDQCQLMVDTYTKTIIFLIVKKIPGEYICETIGLCQPKSIEQFLKVNQVKTAHPILIGAEETSINQLTNEESHSQCVLCEFAVKLVAQQLQKNATQEEAKEVLKKLCNTQMPANLKTECNQFVDVYGDQVIELVLNDLEPEALCQQIGMCQKPAASTRKLLGAEKLWKKLPKVRLEKTGIQWVSLKPAKLVHKVSDDLNIFEEKKNKETMSCSLCIYSAQLVDNFLKKNKTQEEIEEELKLVCNYFPTKLGAQCDAFIAEYGPYIVQLAADDLDPEGVCEELTLCGTDPKKTILDEYSGNDSEPNQLYQN